MRVHDPWPVLHVRNRMTLTSLIRRSSLAKLDAPQKTQEPALGFDLLEAGSELRSVVGHGFTGYGRWPAQEHAPRGEADEHGGRTGLSESRLLCVRRWLGAAAGGRRSNGGGPGELRHDFQERLVLQWFLKDSGSQSLGGLAQLRGGVSGENDAGNGAAVFASPTGPSERTLVGPSQRQRRCRPATAPATVNITTAAPGPELSCVEGLELAEIGSDPTRRR